MNKHCIARQMARKQAAKAWRMWRKTGSIHWRAEYRSALQWDKIMEAGR